MTKTTIKCPHCGNTDLDEIRYIENVISSRRLNGFNEAGTLIISAESDEDMEGATNPRFECHACWETFFIPRKLATDFE